jgi:hypothetical protein
LITRKWVPQSQALSYNTKNFHAVLVMALRIFISKKQTPAIDGKAYISSVHTNLVSYLFNAEISHLCATKTVNIEHIHQSKK